MQMEPSSTHSFKRGSRAIEAIHALLLWKSNRSKLKVSWPSFMELVFEMMALIFFGIIGKVVLHLPIFVYVNYIFVLRV